MNKNTIVAALLPACLLLCIALLGTSCANIIPPTGGPKDTLPPVLIVATPADSSLHFNVKKITLNFDEYVTADNPTENVVIWPNPVVQPEITSKLRTVTIKLKDTLEPNMTYTINFGKSLKDINEGNADSAFRYVFSTGTRLDDNKLNGKVLLAQSGKVDSTLIVVLQRNLNDTAIKKLPPRYYTKLDSKGNFYFYNLPTDSFNVFALPNDYTKRYDDSTKLFAFLNHPVYLNDTTSAVTLYAYAEFKAEEKKTTLPNTNDNVPRKGAKKIEDSTLKMTNSLESERQDFLGNLVLTFSDTLKTVDSTKIRFTDTNYVGLPGMRLTLDSTATRLIVSYPWKPNTAYALTIDSNAVADSSGRILETNDTLQFTTMKESDYGSIRLRFQNLDTALHPVLQILQNDEIIEAISLTSYEWYRKFFRPGEYDLRMLYDTNRNGVWDPGSYNEKKQPEIVRSVTTKEGGKISVKANLDRVYNITL
ncbi:hypothetical protein FC093_02735 [Ilyomonas limi]|uniref:SbsA Ig-like domain-containing protein n=1 Tax=Ilyomonas limi TaxID=2575867 RepID=A0A4U3LCZ5_9BACT|nr:Ig-like domain-containing protein [Ilyomonas limi]TKK71946.1 hypothetical protein FC093_02735 [Ilyomonas limi]